MDEKRKDPLQSPEWDQATGWASYKKRWENIPSASPPAPASVAPHREESPLPDFDDPEDDKEDHEEHESGEEEEAHEEGEEEEREKYDAEEVAVEEDGEEDDHDIMPAIVQSEDDLIGKSSTEQVQLSRFENPFMSAVFVLIWQQSLIFLCQYGNSP